MLKHSSAMGLLLIMACYFSNGYAARCAMYSQHVIIPPQAIYSCKQHPIYSSDEEPYGYYVCYDYRDVLQTRYALHKKYRRFRYHSCFISTIACRFTRCPSQTFAWFRTTSQALNALYRCKENF